MRLELELVEALRIVLRIIEAEDLDEKYNEVCIIQDVLEKAERKGYGEILKY